MTVKYVNIPMIFQWQLFAADCVAEIDVMQAIDPSLTDVEVGVLLLGVSEGYVSSLRSWARGQTTKSAKDMIFSMKRFMLLCNELGLDPRKYFLLDTESFTQK